MSDDSDALVLRQDHAGITTLTLNRPAHFNALSGPLLDALQAQLDRLAGDAEARVVILAANGKGFCAGHDLREIGELGSQPAIAELFHKASKVMLSLVALPQPVIARVHGTATAAGCQLVAQCDLAVASENAKFATSGVNFGLFCSTPGVPLARNLGRKQAMEMLLTGEFIDAGRAQAIGLVNRVVPAAELDAAVLGLAGTIAAKPPAAVAAGKRLFYSQLEQNLESAYRMAGEAIACDAAGPEGREGIAAFLEKRRPDWSRFRRKA